ncbi:MAG TPA: LLM class flavin-dependent oxidoreductase [Candidatus Binataceae bacterium]|nr:LLM class flavin-dependent oxidoreductase [Candidatus Binataceae bacterium]
MRFGLDIPLTGVFSDLTVVANVAQEAEAYGWDGCFVWDHLRIAGTRQLADPWLALALIAQATKRIRFGPLVTPLFRRHLGKLAYETVSLDHLSDGRLVFGVGLGSDVFGEISAFGGPLDDRVRAEMLDEGLTVLTGLWSGQPFDFEGKHIRIKRAQVNPPCLQSPRIPIWIAASWRHKRPMRRAARYDGVVPVRGDLSGPLTPEEVREMGAYIKGFRSADNAFDVLHFGLTNGLQPADARKLAASYGLAGVTWWIETLPLEAQLDQVLERVRLGPPL